MEKATTYCLGCKDFTHNFRPQEVKMINKALREKLNCVVCWLINQGFWNKNTTTTNNSMLYWLMLQKQDEDLLCIV